MVLMAKIDIFREKSVPFPLCPPEFLHGPAGADITTLQAVIVIHSAISISNQR